MYIISAIALAILLPQGQASSKTLATVPPDARAAITKDFKDPDGAEFRNVFVTPFGVCGEVNAKNSYGGYTGYKLFVWQRKSGTAIIMDEVGSSPAAEAKQFCDTPAS